VSRFFQRRGGCSDDGAYPQALSKADRDGSYAFHGKGLWSELDRLRAGPSCKGIVPTEPAAGQHQILRPAQRRIHPGRRAAGPTASTGLRARELLKATLITAGNSYA
jgi:hypothetical protein